MKFWNSLYDKVKVVVLAGLGTVVLALLDVFTSFDWTSSLGAWGPVMAIGVAAVVGYLKKEIAGHQQFFPSDGHYNPVPEVPAPPVGG